MFRRKRRGAVTAREQAPAPAAAASPFGRSVRALTVLLATLVATFAGAPGARSDDNFKVVDGLAVYIGVLPAEMVQGHPQTHAEAAMHGGVPAGTHQYHLVVALFDATTSARIEDAEVTATVEALGHVGRTEVKLEPMEIAGTVTYGGFVNLPGSDRYEFGIELRLPGSADPLRVVFDYEHPFQL